ncbi:MAG: EAL domain-containing protein [Lachnospiraceae bacterium]|nr:EAL domain-containing protein [Lachnospiraceae bacterium]
MWDSKTNRQKAIEIIKELLRTYSLSGLLADVSGDVYLSYFTDMDVQTRFYEEVDRRTIEGIRSGFSDYESTDVTDRSFKDVFLRTIAVRNQEGRVRAYMFLIGTDRDDSCDQATKVLKDILSMFADAGEELRRSAEKEEKEVSDSSRLARERRYYRNLSLLLGDTVTDTDKGDPVERIVKRIGTCVSFDRAMLISLRDGQIKDIKEYVSSGHDLRDRLYGLEASLLSFLDGKDYTISSDSLVSERIKGLLERLGISAAIFYCLDKSSEGTDYLCLASLEGERIFGSDEIDFVNDAIRILKLKRRESSLSSLLRGSNDFIRTFYDSMRFAVAIFDDKTKELIYRNRACEEIFSDPVNEELFRRRFVIGDSGAEAARAPKEFASAGSGDVYLVYTTIAAWQDGSTVDVYTINDITQQKQYQKRIKESADLDDLTGLYNRHRFHLDFATCIDDASVSREQGTLIFVDLDDFNALNDGLGHVLADRFLKKAAWSIQQAVKKYAQCYRLGGDQFAVLVPYSSHENLEQITADIRQRFERPFSLDDNEYYCTACMGIVNFPADGDNEDLLLQRVDYALHQAKKEGKNKTEYFSHVSYKMPGDRIGLEKALREAVADDCREFVVYYQPVVEIRNGRPVCCGAEALVRWNSSKLGFMTPDKFISLAEYLGLIVPIDEHVLITATRKCRYWNDNGHPDYRINVNLSVVQLLQNDVVDVIANAIKITGINPDNLILEITEGMAINDMDHMKEVLTSIHDLGVRLALDDFGTGYSSLSRIKDFPLDEIKIDRCFVKDIDSDSFSDAFVRSVSQLADAVDMNVVVEGVERGPQKDKLLDMNISMIQGFLFDRPLTVDEFDKKYM